MPRKVIILDEQKMFDRFLRLGPSKISGAPEEDAYEFLVSY